MLDRARAKADVADLEQRTGLSVGADRRVSQLSVGEAQRVEILKILYRGAQILVLDEPTAVLSPPEVRELWAVLRNVREQGSTIILITHRLDEVIDLSETITVMRDGATVARLKTSATTATGIAQAMVGRVVALTEAVGVVNRPSEERVGEPLVPALEVKNLVVRGARGTRVVDEVSFTVGAGEILGIAGVEGNGQTELIEAIAGIRPIESGEIFIGPREAMHLAVQDRRRLGLAHVPEDRHGRGLILDYSIADNLILGEQGEFSGKFAMDEARIRARAEERVRDFDIRPPAPQLPARTLSGGNQQNVVIAREMGKDFVVLLASQPTRGVDVGAIEFTHQRLRDARAAGKAVLLVSAELNEVLALADRVAVMYRGKFATVVPAREADPKVIGEYMIGARQSTAA